MKDKKKLKLTFQERKNEIIQKRKQALAGAFEKG